MEMHLRCQSPRWPGKMGIHFKCQSPRWRFKKKMHLKCQSPRWPGKKGIHFKCQSPVLTLWARAGVPHTLHAHCGQKWQRNPPCTHCACKSWIDSLLKIKPSGSCPLARLLLRHTGWLPGGLDFALAKKTDACRFAQYPSKWGAVCRTACHPSWSQP